MVVLLAFAALAGPLVGARPAAAVTPPVVTVHPTSIMVNSAGYTVLTSKATNSATVQWEQAGDGTTWTTIPGATSATFTSSNNTTTTTYSAPIDASTDGFSYRAVFSNAGGSATSNAAVVSLGYLPAITQQPAGITASVGEAVTFVAAASGTPAPTVIWQFTGPRNSGWTTIAGATSPTYTRVVTAADSQLSFRATFKNQVGSVTTTPATLTVPTPPKLLYSGSSNAYRVAGSSLFLDSAAMAWPLAVGQWEASTDDGATWTDLPTSQATRAQDERVASYSGTVGAVGTITKYRARFTNEYGAVVSAITTITSANLPVITSQPESLTVHAGDQTTFTVGFTSDLPATVTWKIGTNTASFPGDGNGTATVTVPVTWTGRTVRATITNAAGSTTTGTSAIVTVLAEPVPTIHPTGGTSSIGGTRTMTAAATASPAPVATWQRSNDGGATWSDYTAVASTMSESNKTYTTQLHADTSEPGTTQWRVVWSNSEGTATSNAATVYVPGPPKITVQPGNATAAVGETATFSVDGIRQASVQWQRNVSGTYTAIAGATDLSYSLPVTSTDLGKRFRVVLTNTDGTATSRDVTIRLPGTLPIVSSNPVATVTVDGQDGVWPPQCAFNPTGTICQRKRTATFSASASDTADSVRWQRSNDGGTTWTDIPGTAVTSGATSTTSYTTPTAVPADDGARFRAVFTNAAGETASNSGLFIVQYTPVVTEHPASATVEAGSTVVFHAAYRGYGSMSWQTAPPGSTNFTAIPNSSGSTLTLNDVGTADDGRRFRAFVLDGLSYTGSGTNSQYATLTVQMAPVVDPVVALPVAREGDTVWLVFSAVGRPALDVVFEASPDGVYWFPVPDAAVERVGDRTTVKVDIVADLANHGWVARARFSNVRGTSTSDVQTLRVAAAGDSSPPVISCAPPAPSTLWRSSEVSASCTATDASPLADPGQGAFSVATAVGAGGESASVSTVPVEVCDVLGQCATSPSYGPFKVDRKAPTAPCTGAPAGWVKVNPSVSCTPADGGSGSTSNSVFNLAATVAAGAWDGDASTASRVLCDKVGNCATIRVDHLKVDRAGPDVTCAAPPTAWSKDNISVPCTAVDPGAGSSGPGTVSAVTNQLAGKESADVQGKATVCDVLGNCTNKVVDGFKIDRKLPTVTCQQADGLWHTDNVVLPCEQTDDGSGLAPTSPNGGARDFTVATAIAPNNYHANTAARGGISCDLVGNCTTPSVAGNKVDRKAPTALCPPGDTAWHGDNVTVTCTVSDIGSGPTSPSLALTTVVAAGEQSTTAATAKGTYCDVAGNCVQIVAPGRYKIDRKGPRVTVTAPAPGSVVVAGHPVTVAYSCTDDGAGLASCTGPVPSGATIAPATIGEQTFSVTGIDAVGNQTTTTVTWHTAAAVSGKVIDPAGAGIEGVTVSRYPATGTGPAIDSVLTGPGGNWQFDQVAPGSYRFGATKDGSFLPRFFGASTLAGAPAYSVDGASPRVVPTLTMTPAAVIGGTVTSAVTGEGLAGVEVAVYANLIPTAAPIALVITDANGNWTLSGLAAGTYRYRMTAPGHILEWHTDAPTKADSTGVVLAAGDQRTDLTDELAAAP